MKWPVIWYLIKLSDKRTEVSDLGIGKKEMNFNIKNLLMKRLILDHNCLDHYLAYFKKNTSKNARMHYFITIIENAKLDQPFKNILNILNYF